MPPTAERECERTEEERTEKIRPVDPGTMFIQITNDLPSRGERELCAILGEEFVGIGGGGSGHHP